MCEEVLGEVLVDDVGDEVEGHVAGGGVLVVGEGELDPETAILWVLEHLAIVIGQEHEHPRQRQRLHLHHSLIT